jgi:hypothetical protein
LGVFLGKILGMKVLSMGNIRHLSKERNYEITKIEKLGYKQKITLKEAISEVAKDLRLQEIKLEKK